jgi:aminoglycoside phosphotransferase
MSVATVGTRLADLVDEAVVRHLGAGHTRRVVIAMSKDDNPKATVLVFPAGARHPALAIKAAATPGAQLSVEREAQALRELARLDPGLVGGTVPRLLEVQAVAGHTLLVATAQRGTPMSTGYHRWRHTASSWQVGDDFRAAASWLGLLGGVARISHAPEGWADRLTARWPGDPAAMECASEAERLEEALGTGAGSVVHGDFWCGNVMRERGLVSGVVDWEHACFGGDPIRDRVRFALAYTLYLDRHSREGVRVAGHRGLSAGPWGNPVRYLLTGRGWYPELVSAFIADGLVATGRSPALWRAALVLGLVEVAALADHPEFARQHLELAAELSPGAVRP